VSGLPADPVVHRTKQIVRVGRDDAKLRTTSLSSPRQLSHMPAKAIGWPSCLARLLRVFNR
jgi:hypothetical protein